MRKRFVDLAHSDQALYLSAYMHTSSCMFGLSVESYMVDI